MNRSEIIAKLEGIVEEYLPESTTLTEEMNLIEDVGLSSLDLMNIVGDVEDTFDIAIDDDDALTIKSVGDLVDYIISQS